MTEAYPLAWPDGWPRTPLDRRPVGKGNFVRGGGWSGDRRAWSFSEARDALYAELKRFSATSVVVSTNFEPNRKGDLVEGRRRPDDQGVAIYFTRKGKPVAMAYDEWKDIESNFRSLTLAIDALRQLERHGGGKMMDKAFAGFAALPAPAKAHEILGIPADASEAEVRKVWRTKIAGAHPDQGGTGAAEINAARDDMLKRLGAA